jgi:hypothetical protein
MSAAVADAATRRDIIAYLKTLNRKESAATKPAG